MLNDILPTEFADYEVLKQIGKGAFGIVYKVRSKSEKQVYALKTIDISKVDKKMLANTLNEIRILCSIDHPNIVGYKEAFIRDNRVCVVMEFVGGGDLLEKIEQAKENKAQLSEERIWRYSTQILNGLRVLHSLKIIHRDVKSANILLSDDHENVKLGDLNLAKVAKEDFANTQIGTPHYLAPEIWLNQRYDYRADIFSLGCVMYEMAALDVPFNVPSVYELVNKITKSSAERIPREYSDELNDVITKFMEKDPERRPTVLSSLLLIEGLSQSSEAYADEETSNEQKLLKTITIPKNLRLLNRKLPKRKRVVEIGKSVLVTHYENFDYEVDENEDPTGEIQTLDALYVNRSRSSATLQVVESEMNISNALRQMCLNNNNSYRNSKRLDVKSLRSINEIGHDSLKVRITNIDADIKSRSKFNKGVIMDSNNGSDCFYNPMRK